MNKSERIKQIYGLKEDVDKEAYIVGDTIHVKFSKSTQLVDEVKKIHGRKYVRGSSTQHWRMPISLNAFLRLRHAQFKMDAKLLQWEKENLGLPVINPDFKVKGLNHPLFPYQVEGVQMLEQFYQRCGSALLADDQGLGKTPEVIAFLQQHPELRPVLIICPANLKMNWYTELHFWLKKPNVQVISGNEPVDITGDFVIINYDILSQWKDNKDIVRKDVWRVLWQALIVDEAHYIGDRVEDEEGTKFKTIRGWVISELRKEVQCFIPITATPGKHRPLNLFTIINLINKQIFPAFFPYAHRYCGAELTPWGWNFKGSSHEEELHSILKHTMMIRRTKQEVFKDLPRKVRVALPFEIDNMPKYLEAKKEFDYWLGGAKSKRGTFKQVETLKQLAVQGKLKASIEWIKDMLETEDKLVIFAEHKLTISALMKEFGSIAVRVDGSTSEKNREIAKHLFQRCARCDVRKEKHSHTKGACKTYVPDLKTRLYIGSSAAKEGNTLTASEHVVFMEFWWSPKDHDQAEDRCYGRAGDLHGATAWYLIASGTIEEDIARTLDIKNMALEKVMDGRDLPKDRMLTELLKEYRRKQ